MYNVYRATGRPALRPGERVDFSTLVKLKRSKYDGKVHANDAVQP